eukprot:Polyplicarium_translucidae@DN2764_c0_g1_i1.p1
MDNDVNVVEVYVDTVGPAQTYEKKLRTEFPSIAITVAEKADAKFPVVSAASILAKTERDRRIENWDFREPTIAVTENLGSGYPGDEQTKSFLRAAFDKIFGFPSVVRFSWSTSRSLMEKSGAFVDWLEADEHTENVPPGRKRKLPTPPASGGGKRQTTLTEAKGPPQPSPFSRREVK